MRIVYNSFDGRYSDSPRAIHEALVARSAPVTATWFAAPGHLHGFPPGTTTVPPGTPEALAALSEADVVVSNQHLPLGWTKVPGCLYLQTWHGTPLKHIAGHEPGAPAVLPAAPDVAAWDVLLSPNRASSDRLAGAFRYEGHVAETGYPRNDALSSPLREDVRTSVREELGIADGTTAVLYTPTWRDDELDDRGRRNMDLRLDLERFTAELGEDHVLLLRLHYWVSESLGVVDVPGVLDVSAHPDVRELYLAADVMVTDYSSTMFDFAVTGKPLLYFTYDLEHYRDDLRGFYVDLEATSPGPLLRTTDELVAALRDLDAVTARYAERYAAFREEFCHLEDGGSTDRVLALCFPSLDRLAPAPEARTSPGGLDLGPSHPGGAAAAPAEVSS